MYKFTDGFSNIVINLFTIMFGGVVPIEGSFGKVEMNTKLMIHASIPMICALVAFIAAFVLIILVLVGYYSREFKKGTLTVLSVVTICLLLAGSVIITLAPKFGKQSLIDSALFTEFGSDIGCEDALEMREYLNGLFTTSTGADVIIASVCGFSAAASMLVALLGLHLRKAEPVAIK